MTRRNGTWLRRSNAGFYHWYDNAGHDTSHIRAVSTCGQVSYAPDSETHWNPPDYARCKSCVKILMGLPRNAKVAV